MLLKFKTAPAAGWGQQRGPAFPFQCAAMGGNRHGPSWPHESERIVSQLPSRSWRLHWFVLPRSRVPSRPSKQNHRSGARHVFERCRRRPTARRWPRNDGTRTANAIAAARVANSRDHGAPIPHGSDAVCRAFAVQDLRPKRAGSSSGLSCRHEKRTREGLSEAAPFYQASDRKA
jgi:hypothetical protein